ncbi:hypothetical protein FXF51_41510 [Nonomuraea sp. PA05]|uniref:hypothetical protein n=1 Tax=Nonomuraea sp. PA05 TaxID=2604466 RepID=UPI0011D39EB0|nr:hypothetical protein [Nonomuraea sp. PA05]TYB56964.1 hypothetical protein FXF51_41510 [Nonomuraea sp. PA05]
MSEALPLVTAVQPYAWGSPSAGPPPGDPARTCKDPFHKPEMVCAPTGFHGLCGFRAPGDVPRLVLGSVYRAVPCLSTEGRQA